MNAACSSVSNQVEFSVVCVCYVCVVCVDFVYKMHTILYSFSQILLYSQFRMHNSVSDQVKGLIFFCCVCEMSLYKSYMILYIFSQLYPQFVEQFHVSDQVKRLIFLWMGFRHMWHTLSGWAQSAQALWPQRKTTERRLSRQIEQFTESSISCIRRCNSRNSSSWRLRMYRAVISAPPGEVEPNIDDETLVLRQNVHQTIGLIKWWTIGIH